MIKKQFFYVILAATCVLSFSAGSIWTNASADDLVSHIYGRSEVKKSTGGWGSIWMYTNEETKTYGTESMLTAVLEFLPGKQLQPPHQHTNEEFTYIIDGGGT